MDFDEEMSSLQIEDLGEYFFSTEENSDNWKGFSLGYMEENIADHSTTASNAVPIHRESAMENQSLLSLSPPGLSTSFSELLRTSNNNAGKEQIGLQGMPEFSTSSSQTMNQQLSMEHLPHKEKEMEELLAITSPFMLPSQVLNEREEPEDYSRRAHAKQVKLAPADKGCPQEPSAAVHNRYDYFLLKTPVV